MAVLRAAFLGAAALCCLLLAGCITEVSDPACFDGGSWSDALVSTVCCDPDGGDESDRGCRQSAVDQVLPASDLAYCTAEGACALGCIRTGNDGANCECTDAASCAAIGLGGSCLGASGPSCSARGLASPCTLCGDDG